jgi:LysR family transcriptional activator of mexEF-oprN operon
MTRITLQHLQYLVALVAERHVTRAAEKVGIGQPAMSSALAKLRIVFCDPILIKTSAGMEPTQRALELARRAHESIDLLSGAQRVGAEFVPETAEGHFRFMASEGVSDVFMPEFMTIVRKQAPLLRFTVGPGDVRRAPEFLRDGDIEFAMGFFQHTPQELHQVPLYPQKLVCIASRDHPEIRGDLSLQQFTRFGHVVWGASPVPYPTLEAIVDDALKERGTSRKVILRVSSMHSSSAVVAGTDLLAVVPERIAIAKANAHSLQVLHLPFPVERVDVTILWHDRWHREPVHAWLRCILKDLSKSLKSKMQS